MANLQDAFEEFHRKIAVSSGNKIVLRMALDSIRSQIRKYFRRTLHLQVPKFRSQGAYAVNTLVNPILGEINLNDGVYLQHMDPQDDMKWPTGAAVRQLLMDAIDSHHRSMVIEKRACVRLRVIGLYNVDLPIYGVLRDLSMLALKSGHGWVLSNPQDLIQWFNSYMTLYGEQLRRIIRYVKAWADFQSLKNRQMPKGLVLSILAARHFQDDLRDDVALAYTFKVISNAVTPYFSVPNPVNINEELAERLSLSQIKHFCAAIEEATAIAISAIRMDDPREASILWRKLFGYRFPLPSDR
jgi:hypothetical protein